MPISAARREVMRQPLRRALATLLLVTQAMPSVGCTRWEPKTQVTPKTISEASGHSIRVHLADGTTYHAQDHRLVGDSLATLTITGAQRQTSRVVPLDSVSAMDVKTANTGATIGLIGGIVAAVVVVSVIAWQDVDYFGD
jgi:hypothetical protein